MDSSSPAAIGRTSPEAGSLRVYFDDDGESYFDLNVNTVTSTDLYFTLRLSPLRDDHCPLQDLFANDSLTSQKSPVDRPSPSCDVYSPPSLRGNLEFGAQRRSVSTRSQDEATGRACPPKRRASTAAAAATGVLNLLVKFPSEKIRNAFLTLARSVSRLKPPSSSSSQPSNRKDELHKSSSLTSSSSSTASSSSSSKRSVYRSFLASLHRLFLSKEKSSDEGRRRVVDISSNDSGLLRAVAEAMNMSSSTGDETGGGAYKICSRTKSAPCSVQSSPRRSWGVGGEVFRQVKTRLENVVERDGSVSAAIAHCKGDRV